MRSFHAVNGWISWVAAGGLTLLSTGCYSSGSGWGMPRFASWNPMQWGNSAAVSGPQGAPQLPASSTQPSYPQTSQSGLPRNPGPGSYATGPYNMSASANPAAPGGNVAGLPGGNGSPAGPGGATAAPAAPNTQGFYNENAYGPPGGSPTQPAQYTADARGQLGPAAPATFESQPAPPANPAPPTNPAWPANPAPPTGFPNAGFEAPPAAGAPAWPNAPVNSTPPAPAWPGAGATSLPAESAPATNPAAPPPGAPGFSDNSANPRGFSPAAPPAAPPTMTYLSDSSPPAGTMGALPAPVTPPGGSHAPQHRADPNYRPGGVKDYLPTNPGGVQPATFERPAQNLSWPGAGG